jgi:predicted transcriptional regulator
VKKAICIIIIIIFNSCVNTNLDDTQLISRQNSKIIKKLEKNNNIKTIKKYLHKDFVLLVGDYQKKDIHTLIKYNEDSTLDSIERELSKNNRKMILLKTFGYGKYKIINDNIIILETNEKNGEYWENCQIRYIKYNNKWYIRRIAITIYDPDDF